LTGQVRRELLGHQREFVSRNDEVINGLAVSADGKKAASVGMDLIAMVWDVTGLPQRKRQPERLSVERLGEFWDALNGQDAQKAPPPLPAGPGPGLDPPGTRPPPVPRLDQARLDRLLADLDSEKFETREIAEKEFARLGRAAEPALRKALAASTSAEQRRRLAQLLEPLATITSHHVDAPRAVDVLEGIATPDAQPPLA